MYIYRLVKISFCLHTYIAYTRQVMRCAFNKMIKEIECMHK